MELDGIKNAMPDYLEQLQSLREIILANAVMVGEIPAPSGKEDRRVSFVCDRFTEGGMQNVSTDEAGNATGILPGTEGENNILLAAHIDTPWQSGIDHAMSVMENTITGPAIGDNSLGVAALATLPTLLDKLDIKLKDNLVFCAHANSLGYGDLEGFRFFMKNSKLNYRAAICTAGVHLGRLSYSSLGMIRGLIKCDSPHDYDWTKMGVTGAIANLGRIIEKLLEIPLPQQPRTNIIFGSVQGGTGFTTTATHATLGFEVRSEQVGMVAKVEEQIKEIIGQVKYESDCPVNLDILARRTTGGIEYTHPLVRTARDVMEALEIKPKIAPSTGALSSMIANGIPALTIGLTMGDNLQDLTEEIEIDPIYKGLTQMIAMLQAIDGGLCDVED